MVLVPGITGTELWNESTGEIIWGRGKNLIRPWDGGHSLARPISDPIDGPAREVIAGDVLRQVELGPISKPIYAPLITLLTDHGYSLGDLSSPQAGDDFFTFGYDWRGDNIFAAIQLRERLDALAAIRGEGYQVDLICQSNGASICRYLLKFGALPLVEAEAGLEGNVDAEPGTGASRFHIRKLILVGTSSGGSIRVLREIHRGRRYIPVLGRRMQPEVLFTFPALYQDLVAHVPSPFIDAEGRAMPIDLFDAETWVERGWSVFQPGPRSRMAERPDLFGDEQARRKYLEAALDRARRMHRLLSRDVPDFPETRYYSLQNGYGRTPYLAMVGAGDDGLLFTGDRQLDEWPYLDALMSRPGDGHATVESQDALSPQELDAMALPPFWVEASHFQVIVQGSALRRLLDFLRH